MTTCIIFTLYRSKMYSHLTRIEQLLLFILSITTVCNDTSSGELCVEFPPDNNTNVIAGSNITLNSNNQFTSLACKARNQDMALYNSVESLNITIPLNSSSGRLDIHCKIGCYQPSINDTLWHNITFTVHVCAVEPSTTSTLPCSPGIIYSNSMGVFFTI